MESKTIHSLFRLSIALKFANGALEIIAAILLLSISPQFINKLVTIFLTPELVEEPNDFIANALLHGIQSLSSGVKTFLIIYLLIHGIVKIGLVISLWKQKLWAYPLAAVFLGLFTVYQTYLAINLHSLFQLILTVIDILILILLKFEYNRITKSLRTKKKRVSLNK